MDKFEIRRLNLRALLRTHCDGRAATLADKIGRSPSYVSRMLYVEGKDGKKRIGEDMRDFIESAFVLPHGWLDNEATAIAEMNGVTNASDTPALNTAAHDQGADAAPTSTRLSVQQARKLMPGARGVTSITSDDKSLVHIPKIKLRLAAGVAGIQVDPERFDGSTWTLKAAWLEKHRYDPDQLIAVDVTGDSMAPGLNAGDIVVVNLADTKPVDGVVYAINYEGEPVIKRLTRDAGRWWLTSDNNDQVKYYRRVCEGDACMIVGRVVKKESDFI